MKVNRQKIQGLITVSVLEGVEMRRVLICNLWSNKLINKVPKIMEALLILFNRKSKLVNFCYMDLNAEWGVPEISPASLGEKVRSSPKSWN